MVSVREPKSILSIVADMEFVVYGYEPSTGYSWFRSGHTYARLANAAALGCVDDATRTEGWVYEKKGQKYVPVRYACLTGDGGSELRELEQK